MDALDRRNISRACWGYYGGFGVFKNSWSQNNFNRDLNTEIVLAMGFTPPVQIGLSSEPLNTGFVIFDDYPNHGYVSAGTSTAGNTTFGLYDSNSAQGEFAILWGNPKQNSTFWFSFERSGNLSYLASQGFFLEFSACAEKPVMFDVRFVNHENAQSIPWRMRYTIDENILPPDGSWHVIHIPLAYMEDQGAWVGSTQTWIGPRGEFSWENVWQLEFNGSMDMNDIYVRFDEIKISR